MQSPRMPLASGGSARSQGQAEDGQDAPRRPVQLQCAAMGPGDLLHQPEAGAVGGPAVRGQSDLRQSDRQTTAPVEIGRASCRERVLAMV